MLLLFNVYAVRKDRACFLWQAVFAAYCPFVFLSLIPVFTCYHCGNVFLNINICSKNVSVFFPQLCQLLFDCYHF